MSEKFITGVQTNIVFPKAAHKCQTAWLSEEKKQKQYPGLLCFSQIQGILNKKQKSLCCNGKMRKELCLSLRKQAASVIKYHPRQKINKMSRKTTFIAEREEAIQEV